MLLPAILSDENKKEGIAIKKCNASVEMRNVSDALNSNEKDNFYRLTLFKLHKKFIMRFEVQRERSCYQ